MSEYNMNINNQAYHIEVYLENESGRLKIPDTLFTELFVSESFSDWKTNGYVIYNNNDEWLERFTRDKKTLYSEPFYFRMDGTDMIEISCYPIRMADGSSNAASLSEHEDILSHMNLTIRGVIYDTEDLGEKTTKSRAKKLYFWDIHYNNSISMNTRVSSGEYLRKYGNITDVGSRSNSDRQVLNGDLLKYICEDKLGAKVSTTIWNPGVRSSFYTSCPRNNVFNDMDYLIKGYVEDGKYPAHFSYDRFDEVFTLQSYKDLMKRYLTDPKEYILFGDTAQVNSSAVPPRTIVDHTYSFSATGIITTYEYMKMSGSDSIQRINSRSMNGYDSLDSKFLINMENGNIDNAKAGYKGMLEGYPKGIGFPLFVSNKDKVANRKLLETQALEATSVMKDIIRDGVLFNDALSFTILGSPSRTTGVFVDIGTLTDLQGRWEDRFLGPWLVIKVDHRITSDGIYVNDIVTVKVNTVEMNKIPEDTGILPEVTK